MNQSGTQLYRVNRENAGVTLAFNDIGVSNVRGFTFFQGQVYLVANVSSNTRLYRIDLNTGVSTLIGIVPQVPPLSIVNHNGSLYVASSASNRPFYRINVTTNSDGSLSVTSTLLGNVANTVIYGMASRGGVLYVNTGNQLQTLDIGSLSLNPVGQSYNLENGMRGISFVGDTLYGVGDNNRTLFSIDITTGAETVINSSPFSLTFPTLTDPYALIGFEDEPETEQKDINKRECTELA